MVRVKRGTISAKSRRYLLRKVKGYRWGRSSKERQAREALLHAGNHAFAHRKKKKGDFRRLWSIVISAALKQHDISYSTFIHALKQRKTGLDRKVLAEIARTQPDTFTRIVEAHTPHHGRTHADAAPDRYNQTATEAAVKPTSTSTTVSTA